MKHSFRPGKFQPVIDVRNLDDPLEDNFTALDSDLNSRFVAVDSHIVEFLRPVKPNIQVGDNLFDYIDLDLLPQGYKWDYPGYNSDAQHSVFSPNPSVSSATDEDSMSMFSEHENKMVSDFSDSIVVPKSTQDVSLQADLPPLHSLCVSKSEHNSMFAALSNKVDVLLRVLLSTTKSVSDLSKVNCIDSKVSRAILRSTVIDAVILRDLSNLEVIDLVQD